MKVRTPSARGKLLRAALASNENPKSEERSRHLVTAVSIGLTCLMLLILARIFLLQSGLAPAVSVSRLFAGIKQAPHEKPTLLDFLQANTSAKILERQDASTLKVPLVAYRGALTDRRGRVLAASQLRYRMFVDPLLVRDAAESEIEKKLHTKDGGKSAAGEKLPALTGERLWKKGMSAVAADVPPELAERIGQILSEEKLHALEFSSDHAANLDKKLSELAEEEADRLFKRRLADLPSVLGDTFGYDEAKRNDLARQLRGHEESHYIVLDDLLTPARLEIFKKQAQNENKKTKIPGTPDFIPGLSTEPRSLRTYPMGVVAGQLVGFTGKEEVIQSGPLKGKRVEKGLSGLELGWNTRLQAQNGVSECVVDRHRTKVWVSSGGYKLPKDGENVQLSIDAEIQRIAEEQLHYTCTKYHVASGQIIVMQPFTGEILAIANFPEFDPNDYAKYAADQEKLGQMDRNRAVTDCFEPGSIFKPIVWSGLVDMGRIHPQDRLDTGTNGAYHLPSGRTLHDAHAGHGHGVITWNEVLAYSSNIGMAIGALRVKPEELHDIVTRFGIGKKTGSGLPGEASYPFRPAKRWDGYTPSSIPMGQSVSVTTLQIMRAYCAIANGGTLPTPTLEAINRTPGDKPAAAWPRAISEDAAKKTRDAMRMVMFSVKSEGGQAAHMKEEGTGNKAESPYYTLFGKTGTAQLPNPATHGYFTDRYISSFIAGAPLDKPRLVVGCFLRDPEKRFGHYGGVVAAPFVRNTMESALIYLGVPTNPGTDPVKMMAELTARRSKQDVDLGISPED